MNKQKILKTGLAIGTAMSLLTMLSSNVNLAAENCKPIPDTNVRYVNATLTDINYDYYNALIRGISQEQYTSEDLKTKAERDEKALLFGSCYGDVVGGIQNNFLSPNVINESSGVLQGLVKNKLENGNLRVIDRYTNGTTLFPTSGQTGVNKPYNEILSNWKFPFIKEANGYYSFDSDKYHVVRDYSSKTFKMHEGAKGGLYPFNNCADNTLEDVGVRNLFFTAKFEIPFYMTSDGKVKNSSTGNYDDMVFNFRGDDDVWVFVDDDLVVDLGGTHRPQTGNINFAKNQVYYSTIYNAQNNTETTGVYKTAFSNGKLSAGKHTLRIFYMERAGGESNLFASFNLQSSGIETKYMEKYTNKQLDSVIKTGPVGEKIELEEKSFTDKVLVEKPKVTEATLEEDLQTFYYWYKSKYNVIADYIDVFDGNKISQSTTEKVLEDEKYSTQAKKITGYTLVEVPANASGTMPHQDVNVKYYYKYTDAKATINYIDKTTGQILNSIKKVGTEGEVIPLEEKSFDNYVLVEKPQIEYKYTKKEQIINYYYKQKGKVTVNYLDKTTKQKLGEEILEGIEGDVVSSKQKTFDNYVFYVGPENNKHTITRDKQEVNYYYIKQTNITVHYVDKGTNEDIENKKDKVLEGTVYKTEAKEFEDYKLVEKPEVEDVLVGRSDLEVYYYYEKLKLNLKVDMNLKQGTINDRYYELKNKTGKIEAEIKEANSSSTSKLYYTIKVTNDQEKIASGMLVDYLPEGYIAKQEDNPLWTISADRIYIQIDNINPQETREYELVLTKKDGIDVCGTVSNRVRIQANEGLIETTLEDNEDINDVVIMPRTGVRKTILGISCSLLGVIIITLVTLRKKLKNLLKI